MLLPPQTRLLFPSSFQNIAQKDTHDATMTQPRRSRTTALPPATTLPTWPSCATRIAPARKSKDKARCTATNHARVFPAAKQRAKAARPTPACMQCACSPPKPSGSGTHTPSPTQPGLRRGKWNLPDVFEKAGMARARVGLASRRTRVAAGRCGLARRNG